jgi:hypothetical protein
MTQSVQQLFRVVHPHPKGVLMRVARAVFDDGDDLPMHKLRVLDPETGRAAVDIFGRCYWP